MGSITAIGLADSVLDLETQLAYHLQGNHYPPVPLTMVQPCIDAIDAYYDEDFDREIPMGHRVGKVAFQSCLKNTLNLDLFPRPNNG